MVVSFSALGIGRHHLLVYLPTQPQQASATPELLSLVTSLPSFTASVPHHLESQFSPLDPKMHFIG